MTINDLSFRSKGATCLDTDTEDIELKYTQQNQAVATFSLSVTRQFKNANG